MQDEVGCGYMGVGQGRMVEEESNRLVVVIR